MEKSSQNLRIMVSFMFMIWTVIFNAQSSTLPVHEQMTSRLFRLLQDMPFLYGLKIRMILLERATMESTHSNILESIKEKIESSFQFSTIKSRMLNGLRMVSNLLWSQVNSRLWLRCTIWMVSRLLNSESNSETPSRFVRLVIFSWSEVLATSRKVRWTSGTCKLNKKSERQSSHALLRSSGPLAVAICSTQSCMNGSRSTMGSRFSVQMAQRFLWSKNPSKSSTMSSGSLMKQVHCPSLTSTSWEKRRARRAKRTRSRNESWSLDRTVLFLRWCANRWLKEPTPPPTPVQRKSIRTCTKNLPRSKLLKLKCKFSHKQIRLAPVWSHQPRTRTRRVAARWKTPISTRSLVAAHPGRCEMTMLQTGEWVNSTMTTITWRSRCRLRRTKAICFSASLKSRRSRLASTPQEERRRRAGRSLSPEVVATSRAPVPKSSTTPIRRSMISDTDSTVDQV